jgi:hypothetical protein
VLHLADGLRLDLANPLARHLEDFAHLFERICVSVADAVAQPDNLALTVRERIENALNLVPQHLLRRRHHRRIHVVVLDKVAEVAVVAVADRPVKTNRVLGNLQDPSGLFDAHTCFGCDFLHHRLSAKLLRQVLGRIAKPAHRLYHMNRYPYRPRMVGYRSRYRLPYPPQLKTNN